MQSKKLSRWLKLITQGALNSKSVSLEQIPDGTYFHYQIALILKRLKLRDSLHSPLSHHLHDWK